MIGIIRSTTYRILSTTQGESIYAKIRSSCDHHRPAGGRGVVRPDPIGALRTRPQRPARGAGARLGQPQTRQLAVRACFDCHSNQTTWPWYTSVAPFSWLTERDVIEGRRRLNFSQWGGTLRGERDMSRIISEGRMPPFYYVWLHPSANLSAAEKTALINGLNATR